MITVPTSWNPEAIVFLTGTLGSLHNLEKLGYNSASNLVEPPANTVIACKHGKYSSLSVLYINYIIISDNRSEKNYHLSKLSTIRF